MLPVVTQITMYFAWVVAGAIMIEIVFTWPGIGLLTYEAVYKRDYPLIQAVFLVFTIAMIIANFIADILYAWLDPRVRF
jgi:peptide/nickel transport system permease protein